MHKLPNLFPYFERKETKKYVRLGVIHTLLYGIFMMLFLILWIVIIALPDNQETYDPQTYPSSYQPGQLITDADVVPLQTVKDLYEDTKKREMQCICTNQDPLFEDFATINTVQYKFCKNIMKRFDFEKCKTFADVDDAETNGYLCPSGLVQDEYHKLASEFLRDETHGAYTLAHFKEICSASLALLDGFKTGILTETLSSPTWIHKTRLESILSAKFTSTLKRWKPMMYASMQHSFGFGRFNTPFKVMKIKEDESGFEELKTTQQAGPKDEKEFYAISTENSVFGEDPSEPYSLY